MVYVKITNVKYYVGGGQKSIRIRKMQNISMFLPDDYVTWSRLFTENYIYWNTRGKYVLTKSSKLIEKWKKHYKD